MDLFFYGTLCHDPLLTLVLGRTVEAMPARLDGHKVSWVSGQPFPMIAEVAGAEASGVFVRGLTDDDVARLNFYEGGFAYDLRDVVVQTSDGATPAQVYFPNDPGLVAGDDWDLDAWVQTWGAVACDQAHEVMARYGRQSTQEVAPLMPFMRARAWARQLAANPAPSTLRRRPTAGDVALQFQDGGHDGFFRMRRFSVQHRRFDGTWSPTLDREAMVGFDVAMVLPYDPKTDTVLMVEQIRFGPIMRGDPGTWILEPIAGFIEAGETPQTAARREALEEAGLTLRDLRPILGAYPSPGYVSEFYHFFLAICDLSTAGGLGGAEAEHEDIRSHVVGFDDALALLDSGEINAAPLAMMLLWLARARPALRAAS